MADSNEVVKRQTKKASTSLTGREASPKNIADAADRQEGEDRMQQNNKNRAIQLQKEEDDKAKANPPQYRKGGLVKKSGMAKVHRGERVLTKSQNRKYGKS